MTCGKTVFRRPCYCVQCCRATACNSSKPCRLAEASQRFHRAENVPTSLGRRLGPAKVAFPFAAQDVAFKPRAEIARPRTARCTPGRSPTTYGGTHAMPKSQAGRALLLRPATSRPVGVYSVMQCRTGTFCLAVTRLVKCLQHFLKKMWSSANASADLAIILA